MASQLNAEIAVLDDALTGFEGDIAKLEGKLREARSRQSSISVRLESAENKIRLRDMFAGARTQDAFSRFDELERRVDLAEGRAEAMGMGSSVPSLEDEISALQTSDKVDAELEAMKAALKKKG